MHTGTISTSTTILRPEATSLPKEEAALLEVVTSKVAGEEGMFDRQPPREAIRSLVSSTLTWIRWPFTRLQAMDIKEPKRMLELLKRAARGMIDANNLIIKLSNWCL